MEKMNVDFAGHAYDAPPEIVEETMDILGWLTLKKGPFELPPRWKMVEDLSNMAREGKAIMKTVEKDKDGKTIANHIFVADVMEEEN